MQPKRMGFWLIVEKFYRRKALTWLWKDTTGAKMLKPSSTEVDTNIANYPFAGGRKQTWTDKKLFLSSQVHKGRIITSDWEKEQDKTEENTVWRLSLVTYKTVLYKKFVCWWKVSSNDSCRVVLTNS